MEQTVDRRAGILAGVGAALFRVEAGGGLIDPGDDLARLLIGPAAAAADLKDESARDFWVEPGHRDAFLSRVRAAGGQRVTEVLLLTLRGQRAFCRCSSTFEAPKTFQGMLVRLEDTEEWVNGNLLASLGWAYFQTDRDERTTYASKLDAELVGQPDRRQIVGMARADTHWWDREERRRFFDALRAGDDDKFEGRVRFRHRQSRVVHAELHGRRLPPTEAFISLFEPGDAARLVEPVIRARLAHE